MVLSLRAACHVCLVHLVVLVTPSCGSCQQLRIQTVDLLVIAVFSNSLDRRLLFSLYQQVIILNVG